MPEPHSVGKVVEFLPDKPRSLCIGQERIAIFRVGERFFALEDRCSHAEARLSDGWVEGLCVSCPWHGAQFDLETGAALSLPAILPVKTYPVTVVDGEVMVTLPEAG